MEKFILAEHAKRIAISSEAAYNTFYEGLAKKIHSAANEGYRWCALNIEEGLNIEKITLFLSMKGYTVVNKSNERDFPHIKW